MLCGELLCALDRSQSDRQPELTEREPVIGRHREGIPVSGLVREPGQGLVEQSR